MLSAKKRYRSEQVIGLKTVARELYVGLVLFEFKSVRFLKPSLRSDCQPRQTISWNINYVLAEDTSQKGVSEDLLLKRRYKNLQLYICIILCVCVCVCYTVTE